jgi:hypothetical protein
VLRQLVARLPVTDYGRRPSERLRVAARVHRRRPRPVLLHDLACDVVELAARVARPRPQVLEGVVDVQMVAGGEHALGLLDHDAAVQRLLQLVGQAPALGERAMVGDVAAGHVGEHLGDLELLLDHTCGLRVVEVHGPDAHVLDQHRDAGHGTEARLERGPAVALPA